MTSCSDAISASAGTAYSCVLTVTTQQGQHQSSKLHMRIIAQDHITRKQKTSDFTTKYVIKMSLSMSSLLPLMLHLGT